MRRSLLAVGATVRADDKPTLKDAYKNDFYVGVAINRTIATGAAVRADNVNRHQEQVEKDIALVKEQFNQISPENDLKWALIQPREGADGYQFRPGGCLREFRSEQPDVYRRAHARLAQSDAKLGIRGNQSTARGGKCAGNEYDRRRRFGGGFGYNGPRASREELLQRMHDHIAAVVGRYKGKIKVWDVVNEAVADNGTNILRNSLWLQIIGPDFIAKAFEYAHEADPDAILRYNDYGLESPGKRHKLITLIKSLQAEQVPVMAIGSQTHVSVSSPSFEAEDQALTELETLGLPIHITELDVNGAQAGQRNAGADVANNSATTQGGLVNDANQRLAEQYAKLFKAFLKHKSIRQGGHFLGRQRRRFLARRLAARFCLTPMINPSRPSMR